MSEWINVTTRLPDKQGYCDSEMKLIREKGIIYSAYYYNGRWVENCDDMFCRSYNPTEWKDYE